MFLNNFSVLVAQSTPPSPIVAHQLCNLIIFFRYFAISILITNWKIGLRNRFSAHFTDRLNECVPTITVGIIESLFCNTYGVECTPELWLTNQGQEKVRWPRFGTLNSVISTSETNNLWPEV